MGYGLSALVSALFGHALFMAGDAEGLVLLPTLLPRVSLVSGAVLVASELAIATRHGVSPELLMRHCIPIHTIQMCMGMPGQAWQSRNILYINLSQSD